MNKTKRQSVVDARVLTEAGQIVQLVAAEGGQGAGEEVGRLVPAGPRRHRGGGGGDVANMCRRLYFGCHLRRSVVTAAVASALVVRPRHQDGRVFSLCRSPSSN